MNKQYVIKYDSLYVKLIEDEKRIELKNNISLATFFDSEEFAYEAMIRNKEAFHSPYTSFYSIECVVVVFGGNQ